MVAEMKKPLPGAAAQLGSNLLRAMEVFEAVAETGSLRVQSGGGQSSGSFFHLIAEAT